MGFITLHEMEAFDNVMLMNYGEMGLEFVMGNRLVPLMCIENFGIPT